MKKEIISNPSLISFSNPSKGNSFGFVKNHIPYGKPIDNQLTYDENQKPKLHALEWLITIGGWWGGPKPIDLTLVSESIAPEIDLDVSY